MKVILIQDVPSLGKAGDVKEVRKGHGFNYLLPEGLAQLATPGALKSVKHLLARTAKDKAEHEAGVQAVLAAVDGKTITIAMKAKDDKLFGSVTKQDIAAALAQAGSPVEKEMLVLDQPIKSVGEYAIPIVRDGVRACITLAVISA